MITKLKDKIKIYGIKFCILHACVILLNHCTWNDWRLKNIILNKFDYSYLKRRYKKNIQYEKTNVCDVPKIIWTCWLQGEDKAPELIDACWNSMKRQYPGYKFIILTEKNLDKYIKFPEYIINKYRNGIIPKAQYSDLIRLSLLNEYGGLWIDSTVYCTNNHLIELIRGRKTKLFIYKGLFSLDTSSNISNWMMYSIKSNPYLLQVQNLLYEYWKTHDKLINYFIFHLFFILVSEIYDHEFEAIPDFDSDSPHILQKHLFDKYNPIQFHEYMYASDFHKLTHKFDKEYSKLNNTNYRKILETR